MKKFYNLASTSRNVFAKLLLVAVVLAGSTTMLYARALAVSLSLLKNHTVNTAFYHHNGTNTAAPNPLLTSIVLSSGTLTPTFYKSDTLSTYSATALTSTIKVTPTANAVVGKITVNGSVVVSGKASSAITISSGVNIIKIVVTATDMVTTRIYTLKVSSANNAQLSSLAVANGTLTSTFLATDTIYSVLLPESTGSEGIIATAASPSARIAINSKPVTSGKSNGPQTLKTGANADTVVVTAADGVTRKRYFVTVYRGNAIPGLYGFKLNTGQYTPNFSKSILTYTSTTSDSVVRVYPDPEPKSTAFVTGSTSGGTISLHSGENTITFGAIAQNGFNEAVYTVKIKRVPVTDANLSALSLSNGTLSPAFADSITSYTASVAAYIKNTGIIPTADATETTITVNGAAVLSGKSTGPQVLSKGPNVFTIVVTAPNGTTTKTYTVTVNKGTDGLAENTIAMKPYPVPFTNTLKLDVGKDNINNLSVVIYDVLNGSKVYTKSYVNQSGVLQMDLSSLHGGVYSMHVVTAGSEKVFKILK